MNEGKKKKAQNLIGIFNANKISNWNSGGVKEKKKEKKRKKCKRIYRVSQTITITNGFLESLLSESFPSLGVTVQLISLGCPPTLYWSLDPAVESAQILIWSYFCVFLPPMSTAIRTGVCSLMGALSGLLYIPQTQSLPSWSCGFYLKLVQLVGRFWVFFRSHTAPGFQLWFYFHLYMWVVHWGLLLRLPWRAWVCRCEGQLWRWFSCMGRRGSGSARYSGALAAKAAGNIVL